MSASYIFSVLPILFVFLKNEQALSVTVLFIPTLVVALVNFSLLFVARKLKKLSINDGDIVLFWCIFWFTIPLHHYLTKFYPNVVTFNFFYGVSITIFILGAHKIIHRIRKNFGGKLLRIFGYFLLAATMGQILYLEFRKTKPCTFAKVAMAEQKHPNVYHILLDAYANCNTMDRLHYDNRSFYKQLNNNGFIVYPSSWSNYPFTQPSVASMLNMNYLSEDVRSNASKCNYMISHNTVFNTFKKNGYNIYLWQATLPFKYHNNACIEADKQFDGAKFCFACFSNTPIYDVVKKLLLKKCYHMHAQQIDDTFAALVRAKDKYGAFNNVFYAHILCPHAPMLWDSKGALFANPDRFDGFLINRCRTVAHEYVWQIKVLNQKVLHCIEQIVKQYEKEDCPIIILHGDHGAFIGEECSNLFALHIPVAWWKDAEFLPFINLYRFVFNHLLGSQYQYLQSHHYFPIKSIKFSDTQIPALYEKYTTHKKTS
ncbi:MAG: hypothetical protein LBD69_02930 [Puniceicoccales bacterium]|nr:hypothetical protein [Puniceicoccales bacterium]